MHYCLLKYRRRHLLVLDDLVNTWTGKALPKQHLQFNENSLTQKKVLSIGVVLIVLVMLHVLLSINNFIKRKLKIIYV